MCDNSTINGTERILNNYSNMDETGKEKLKEVAEKICEIREITDSNKENEYGNKRFN